MSKDTLFHVSSKDNRESILQHGLSIDFDNTGYDAVFLTTNANEKSDDNWDVWKVDVSNLEKEEDWTGFSENEKWYILFETIQPSRISLAS